MTMIVVVDASAAASWLIADESDSDSADPDPGCVYHVPGHFWFEIRNVIIQNERRGRLSIDEVKTALNLLSGLAPEVDSSPDENRILGLSRRFTLSFYDAAYLALAERLLCPLQTLDKALIRAAEALTIPTRR